MLAFTCLLAGQAPAQTPYFQQEVNYRIRVTLDDAAHTISGDIEIEYHNNAPKPLDTIWMHLWGNAFRGNDTEFAKQELRTGSTQFYFADEASRGGYSGLDFSADGTKLAWALTRHDPDIAWLKLPLPLRNGEKTTLQTPFTLKIPASWSRLGHVGTSYQMTQWFPKPAVYDATGWHPMPYLDMGEFYSEFGNFDVSITLPENYVVGATGTLQTEGERRFLERKVIETQALVKSGFPAMDDKAYPPSATTMKTLRWTAERVHDFAWFADKRFHVLRDTAILPSGKQVDAWAMFTSTDAELWARGAEYVRRAVEFYSQHVGEYPWPQATAVHSALSAGGGMEYPMITVIGPAQSAAGLDDVITHEVGHNWFYGLLASNERDHPWMDEGINSYYEHRYMRQHYGSRSDIGMPKFLARRMDGDLYELGIQFQCRRRLDQAPQTHSDHFTAMNYGLMAYMKTASAFHHLEQYLGTAAFDRAMQSFFAKWAFKHPQPADLRAHMERETGKQLGWLFDGFLYSTALMDYALVGTSPIADGGHTLRVRNLGELPAPFPVTGYRDSVAVRTAWFEGIAEGEEREVSFPHCEGCHRYVLDAGHATLDQFRKNNTIRTGGLLRKMEPPQLRAFTGSFLESSSRTTLSFVPIAAGNLYDGPMLGLLHHNGLVPARMFQYQWTPLYGAESGKLVGTANVGFNFFPKAEKVERLTVGFRSKSFTFRNLDSLATPTGFASPQLRYRTLVPFARLALVREPRSKFYQTLQLRGLWLEDERAWFHSSGPDEGLYGGVDWNKNLGAELSWELGDRRALNPYSLRAAVEYFEFKQVDVANSLMKLSAEANVALTYAHKRNVYARLFVGGHLWNDFGDRGLLSPAAYNLTGQGFNDYRFDDLYFGRSEPTGFWSQQIHLRDGGMKVPLGSPFSEGRSNRFIFAINLKADLPQDLPLKLPLRPYFDFGYYDDARPISSGLAFADQVWWQGGVALELGKGIFGVYLPIVNSKALRGSDQLPGLYDTSGRDKWHERIAFTLDLTKLNPWQVVDNIQL